MATLETLQREIESAQELQSVVKTMKSLAAASIRQYERATESLAGYNETIELGLQVVLRHPDARSALSGLLGESIAGTGAYQDDRELHGTLGAVIFGSDQGMCGQFNERIAEYALDVMNGLQVRHRDRSLVAVGSRVQPLLRAARQHVVADFSMPSSADTIPMQIQNLLVFLEEWRTEEETDSEPINYILLFYNVRTSQAGYQPHRVFLLPLDPEWLRGLRRAEWPTRVLPTFSMSWQDLFSSLIRQSFVVALYRAFAESLAAENASRLSSMEAAERSIEDRLSELATKHHRLRQRSITEELLDITAGFEALTA